MAKEKPVIQQMKKRKWKWIGYTLRKDSQAVERQILDWNHQGQCKRGRPKRTWRRVVEEGIGKVGKTWKEIRALAQNRIRWRCFVETS
jgi:ribonuclease HI